MEDFQEALRYDPDNIEFKEGWQSCRDEMETGLWNNGAMYE